MALFCEESGNSKGSECKNVVTTHLEEGKYIWFLDKLQDSISKTNSNAGSDTIPVSNQYDKQHTAKSNTSAPWQSKNLQIRSNKSKRHCHSTEYKLSCSQFVFFGMLACKIDCSQEQNDSGDDRDGISGCRQPAVTCNHKVKHKIRPPSFSIENKGDHKSHLTHPYAGIIQIRLWVEVVNFLSACRTSSPVINPYVS